MRFEQAIECLCIPTRMQDRILGAESLDEALVEWRALLPVFGDHYRERAYNTHPDRNGGTADLFLPVARAWEVLRDEEALRDLWTRSRENGITEERLSGVFEMREPPFLRR